MVSARVGAGNGAPIRAMRVIVHLLGYAWLRRPGIAGQDRTIKHLQSQMLEQERPSGLALEDPALNGAPASLRLQRLLQGLSGYCCRSLQS